MKVSIIVTAYNQLEYTKLCVESILKNSSNEYELILINNGSSDGTKEYFRNIKNMRMNTLIVHYEGNEIVEKIGNDAVKIASGEYIIGINNDTICPKNWVENMIDCLESFKNIGMVGVRSNCISGRQQIYPGLYETETEFYKIAEKYENENHDNFEIDRVAGVCAIYKKDDFIKVGGVNENLSTNGADGGYGFSDDDLSNKFLNAGYKLMIANNVFIHHFGSITAKDFHGDMVKAQEINRKKYDKSN